MSENIIEIKNLKTEFYTKNGVVTAVDGVDFKIKKGEILGVVGESGCGKSVTSMSILRLISPNSGKISEGEIIFKGQDILKKSEKEMRDIRGNEIAMIFQDSLTALNPFLTIGSQLIEAITTHKKVTKKEASKKSIEMLKKVGIPSPELRMKEYPHQLSGGMRQRVIIAMALSCDASLLIADEPTTALDVTIQAQILELIKELKETLGTSIMLITHDMGVVAEMADNIMVMYAGKVMEYSDAKSIFKTPMHPYSQGLLASIPRLDNNTERLYTIKGTVPNPLDMPKGCRFCTRCNDAMSVCSEKEPPLLNVGNNLVRCWKYYANYGGNKDAKF